MKKVLNIIFATVIATATLVALSSCDRNNGPTPDDGGNEYTGEFPQPLDHSDVKFPIDWTPYNVEKGANGVSIEVTNVDIDDFTFVCRPGAGVKSFKVCAFSLSGLYNIILEQDWTGGVSAAAVENILRSYIHEGSSGNAYGYVGGADVVYNVTEGGDNDMEITWSEAGYTYVPPVVPDSEYIILALSYIKADGQVDEELSICYLRTATRASVGTPDIIAEHTPLYGGVRLNYAPMNAESVGFYEFTLYKDEFQEYVREFGERMYRDYLRNMSLDDAYSFTGTNNPFPMVLSLTEAESQNIISTAVAVDRNGIPGELRTFEVPTKAVPAGAVPAEAVLTVDMNHVGSLVYWVNASMSKYTANVRMNHLTAADAETIKSDPEALEALKATLFDEGWVIGNPNFSFNDEAASEEDKATGDGASERAYRIDMKDILPDTEYVVAYVAVNYYGQMEEVMFTEPFKTKARNITEPALCAGSVEASLDTPTAIGFTIRFTYNPEEVASYYWQVVAPTVDGQGGQIPGFQGEDQLLKEGITHAEWMNYFFKAEDLYGNPLCNVWFFNWDDLVSAGNGGTTVENSDGTVTDRWTFSDMVPGTTYQVVVAAEDWNGNVGEAQLYTIATTTLNPGPNPVTDLTAQLNVGSAGFNATFTLGQDAGELKVMQATTSSEMNMSYSPADLVSGKVKADGFYTAAEFEAAMFENTILNGLSYYTDAQWPYTDSVPCILMCVPVGRNDDGTPAYGDIKYVIYDGEKLSYDVEDYF